MASLSHDRSDLWVYFPQRTLPSTTKYKTVILMSKLGVLKRRDDRRPPLRGGRSKIHPGRLGLASPSIQVRPSYLFSTSPN
jgi:hypothetical protein